MNELPTDGAIIFTVNHQSTFLDAVLPLYRYKKSGYFLMRSDLFKGKMLNAFFRALHLLPIYRSQDGAQDIRTKNLSSFRKNAALLLKGHPLLIFPEGTSRPAFQLKPLKKGTARMAINFLQEEFQDKKLYLVPVALQYENLLHSGGRLWIHYLKAIPVHQRMKDNPHLPSLYNELTQEITHSLDQALLTDDDERSVEAFFSQLKSQKDLSLAEVKTLFLNFKGNNKLKEKANDNRNLALKIAFLPAYLLSKLINRLVNDKVYQLSILCYSGMILGFLQILTLLSLLLTS